MSLGQLLIHTFWWQCLLQAGGESKLALQDVRGRVAAVTAIALDRLLDHVR